MKLQRLIYLILLDLAQTVLVVATLAHPLEVQQQKVVEVALISKAKPRSCFLDSIKSSWRILELVNRPSKKTGLLQPKTLILISNVSWMSSVVIKNVVNKIILIF